MINFKEISLRRGAKLLLSSANLTLYPGEKVGLVGRNGAGKSSIFSLLAGRLHEDGGTIEVPKDWRRSEVAQDMPEDSCSAREFVILGDQALTRAAEERDEAERANDGDRLAHALLALQDLGEHTARSRAETLLFGLGFTVKQFEQAVNTFSGGWRMRLQLARALMCPADLLLLDEPTNHLDLDALVWLESWLISFPGTLLLISHDREFLDRITGVTVYLADQQLQRYSGNYSKFEQQHAEQQVLQRASYQKQQAQVAHLEQFINRFKAKASKAKQAQSRVKALARLQTIAPVLADAEFTFEFAPPTHLPNPMLNFEEVSCGYQQPSTVTIINNINRSLLPGQRIGILGANGQGKSTLVKTIVGALPVISGSLTLGKGLRLGYFAQQELDVLRPDETSLQHLTRTAQQHAQQTAQSVPREQELRNFLGRFNFSGEMMQQTVGSMSGGERARLVLALIVWQKPNILVLDEPTNHLDLVTREALNVAINQFEGAVLLVSHDRTLLRAVCDEFWLVADHQLKNFEGDIDDYQQYLLQEAKLQRQRAAKEASIKDAATSAIIAMPEQANTQSSDSAKQTQPLAQSGQSSGKQTSNKPAAPPPATADSSSRTANTQRSGNKRPVSAKRQLDKIEQNLTRLTTERQQIEVQLAATTELATLQQLGGQLTELMAQIDTLEHEWLSLSEQV